MFGTTSPTSVTHCKNVFPSTVTTTAKGEVVTTPSLLGQLYQAAFTSLHSYMSTEDSEEVDE